MANPLKEQMNLQQVDAHTYTISHHIDWSVGPVLHGGCIAAAIHHVASTHLTSSPELSRLNQPDILTLHFDFLRGCESGSHKPELVVVVTHLKLGALTSTFQLSLSQGGKLRVFATATSINFDFPAGPSLSLSAVTTTTNTPGPPPGTAKTTKITAWEPSPPLPPPPKSFRDILAHKPDENWIPGYTDGEVIPLTKRMLSLHPRKGHHQVEGVVDTWNTFLLSPDPSKPSSSSSAAGGDQDDDEVTTTGHTMDSTHLTLMTDMVLSLSDTLLRIDGGLYDAHTVWKKMSSWAEENPGSPARLTNSLREARKAEVFNNTVTLDVEFKRRVPEGEGVGWTFTRSTTRMLEGGRMDLDVVIRDEGMGILCLARQVILVLGSGRKFGGGKKNKGPSL